MTAFQQQQRESAKLTIQRIIDAAQQPSTFKSMAEATGLCEATIRTVILRNPQYFNDLGFYPSSGYRPMKMYQALNGASVVAPKKAMQALYSNPYHQLMQTPDYMDEQTGSRITSSTAHNVRPSNKSARAYVSGSTLA